MAMAHPEKLILQANHSRCRDQYATEAFYRLEFLEGFSVTPDVQFILGLASEPQRDFVGMFGLRTRLVFLDRISRGLLPLPRQRLSLKHKLAVELPQHGGVAIVNIRLEHG